MTHIEEQHLPYAQSFKNFDRMTISIKLAIDVLSHFPSEQHWRFDPLHFEHAPLSPETFAARFRDAVRFGVKYGYRSNLFTPQELMNLDAKMEVSLNAEPPYVWVYNKAIRSQFLNRKRENSEKPQEQPSIPSNQQAAQTTYTITLHDASQIYTVMQCKAWFNPPLIVTLLTIGFMLEQHLIEQLTERFDCSIVLVRENEYLIA